MAQPLTKAGLISTVAEVSQIDVQEVTAVLDALAEVIEDEVANGTAVSVPGLVKFVPAFVAAKPRRKGVNPWTQEEQWFNAKPAALRLKARPMPTLKNCLPGPKSAAGKSVERATKKRVRR